MPSSLHESVVELFRADPRLIEALVGPRLGLSGLGALKTLDAALSDPRPVERRADLVIAPAQGPVFILEVQLKVDTEKRWTWPSYAVLARDRLRREVLLVVLTLRRSVAAWAAEPIALDAVGSRLVPVVIGPAEIPLLTDAGVAADHPEQLVLSALAHGRGVAGKAIAAAAAAAVPRLDVERARTYSDLILKALGGEARAALEAALFENYEYQSDFFRKLIAKGLAEGIALGRAEGEAKGMAEGEAKGEAKGMAEGKAAGVQVGQREGATRALLEVLRSRQLAVDASALARIQAAPDAETLLCYLNRALTASTVDEVLGG